MDCPKCVGKLQSFRVKIYGADSKQLPVSEAKTAKIKALDLDKCFVCSGMWFDKGELQKLRMEKISKATIASKIDDGKLYRRLNEKGGLCPRCKKPMKKALGKNRLKKVNVDLCGKCRGVWLDGGEVNYILAGGATKRFINIYRFFRDTKHIEKV